MSPHEQAASPSKQHKFQVNEKVLCYHGSLIYEAKLLKKRLPASTGKHQDQEFFVHYRGWNKNKDEWVSQELLMVHNKRNLQKQQDILDAANKKNRNKKPVKLGVLTNNQTKRHTNLVAESASESEEDYEVYNANVRIELPEELENLVQLDFDTAKIHRLPAAFTVDEILEAWMSTGEDEFVRSRLDDVVKGIRKFFNYALDTRCLYAHERDQLNNEVAVAARRQVKTPQWSSLYGGFHLLRFMTLIGELMGPCTFDAEHIECIKKNLAGLCDHMVQEKEKYFVEDFIV